MPKIGVVGTTGGWSSEKLADVVAEKTGRRFLITMDQVRLDLGDGSVRSRDIDLMDFDALLIKKVGSRYSPDLMDRLEILRFVNERGVPIFSKPIQIMRVLDRLSCTVTLKTGGMPIPDTTVTEDIQEALDAVARYREAVFKPLYTSKARGMVVIKDGRDAEHAIREVKRVNSIMYIQKRIHHPGKDLGVVFLGGEYLTTYARSNKGGAWNTTTHSGGQYESHTPTSAIVDLAKGAQDLFGLDFTCVDIVETKDGPLIFEVSAFGGFRGIQTANGLDAAHLLADYVLNRI